MSERHFTVIGPSNSGKTTYFAALYYLLKNADDQYFYRLDRNYDIQDRTYLNEISENWANLKPIKHTESNVYETLELPLVNQDGSERATIYIPDLAGEFFSNTLTSRSWDQKVASQLARSNGLLLFMNVKDFRSVELMDENWAARVESNSGIEQKTKKIDAEPWEPDPEQLPSDVLLTDLIQQVHFQDSEKKHRVTILLSAWDILSSKTFFERPDLYFAKRFPLLSQFLESLADRFQVAIFGVSAYGTSPEDKTKVKTLEDCDPYKRVFIVGSTGKGHDITLPLMHLMNHE